MWFKMQVWTVEETVAKDGHLTVSTELDCDISTAFKAFNEAHLPRWFKEISSAKWLSAEKEMVGAIRQVNLNTMNVREHFTHWEENKRFTFYITSATIPLLDAMIEDCQFKALENGKTSVEWNIYYRPKSVIKLLSPIIRPIYENMFKKGVANLETYVLSM